MRPFLKWAGGKHRLVPFIREMLPQGRRLIEPFAGSGAVFAGIDGFQSYLLADVNADLIALYGVLQGDVEGFVREVEELFSGEFNDRDSYERLRKEFNSLQAGRSRRRAAIFVYLNRHGFNGLCRYNLSGGFNVPFGSYAAPYFPRAEMLAFAEKAAKASFVAADFREVLRDAREGDVVYCDPPYLPIGQTGFTAYAAGGFTERDQRDLAELAVECARKGIPVLLSNHDTPLARSLYSAADIRRIEVPRSISRDGTGRTKVGEVLALFTEGSIFRASMSKEAA
jgi:DNA adenine methylase